MRNSQRKCYYMVHGRMKNKKKIVSPMLVKQTGYTLKKNKKPCVIGDIGARRPVRTGMSPRL
jgi:hypothetical protein